MRSRGVEKPVQWRWGTDAALHCSEQQRALEVPFNMATQAASYPHAALPL